MIFNIGEIEAAKDGD
jgi:hypothetical protein